MPINVGGEAWGVVGVTAVRQALRYLRLQGNLADQEHLTACIRTFLVARWNFVWDDIVLVWLYLGEEDELRWVLLNQVFTYINNPAGNGEKVSVPLKTVYSPCCRIFCDVVRSVGSFRTGDC